MTTARLHAFDLCGHGGSEVVPGSCTMADLGGDVLALLDALGVDRFSYAGCRSAARSASSWR